MKASIFYSKTKRQKINKVFVFLFGFGFFMRCLDGGARANNNTSRQADGGQSCIQQVSDVADIACLLGCS
jgi:hypothetical protein